MRSPTPAIQKTPPYARIRPEWLHDIDSTEVQFWLQPGVPDIKSYLEIEQPIDIQNARYVLGLRVFHNVSAIETMLDWVGIEGKIREKVLKNWYQRVATMQLEIEEEKPTMSSLALPYEIRPHDEEAEYDSEEDGEYELDDEYDTSLEVANINPVNASTTTTTTNKNIIASPKNHKEVHQIQINEYIHINNINIKPATVAHNFWPLFNRMCIRDLNFFRLQMDELCSHISEDINWAFLLCEPCTDVSAMIFLYVTSVWQSRPVGKEDELAGPVIWSLAMQLRVIVPSEQILRVVEHRKATDQLPGLLPISQWR